MPHVGYPSVPIISIVLSALLTIDLAWLAPATSRIGILIMLPTPTYFCSGSRRATCQSGLALARELFMYASKIKETTNGSRSCSCREAWQKVEVVPKRRVAPNGQLDERKRVTQNGEDKAQGKAHAQTHEKLEVVFAVQTVAPAEDSTCENQAEELATKRI